MKLHGLDISIVCIYFSIVFYIGWHFAKRDSGTDEYFLAGRSLHWSTIGFSLFASNISSTTLVGLAGAAYASGIAISNYEWMASIVLVFFAVFFIPSYLHTKIFTMPEFLELRFDWKCRRYFSGLNIIGNIFIDTAATLYAGCLVLRFFYPGLDLTTTAIVLALIAGVYTSIGGLSAVVYTDVLQAIVLLIGATIISYLSFSNAGSWSAVMASTPPEFLSVIRPADDPVMPFTGLIVGVPILGFYFWCTNQFIVQRVLGARDINHARWGALFGGLLKLPVLFIMVFPGISARKLFPDLVNPDLVFPTLVTELLPIGIQGLVLAALLAAIMSSLDSTLNSASTLVTMDFVKVNRPNISDKGLTRIGRGCTLVFMTLSALWVPVVASAETLFHYLQSALAFLFPPVVAVFILGFFVKRITARGAFGAMLGGHVVSLSVFIFQINEWYFRDIHFLELTGVFFTISALIAVLLSLGDSSPSSKNIDDVTWSRASHLRACSELNLVAWYQDYRLHSALLLLLTAALVWTFR
jgi:SSS family solute:Na+ symporter